MYFKEMDTDVFNAFHTKMSLLLLLPTAVQRLDVPVGSISVHKNLNQYVSK